MHPDQFPPYPIRQQRHQLALEVCLGGLSLAFHRRLPLRPKIELALGWEMMRLIEAQVSMLGCRPSRSWNTNVGSPIISRPKVLGEMWCFSIKPSTWARKSTDVRGIWYFLSFFM